MRKPFFRGDTLIEVAIAIGIFSLVAISVVAVINTSTSGIQTTLETTMTRNEIDAQAETLRYIHDAYEAEKDLASDEQTYSNLWHKITALAKTNRDNGLQITDFTPTTCSALYEKNTQSSDYKNSVFAQNAFILNPKLLNSTTPENALLSVNSNASIFETTPLYPRLFNSTNDLNLTTNDLTASNANLKAQGLYIIPIADQGTALSDDSGNTTTQISYYDFYIRSCWYAAGADAPSTISTVIRLYNPDVDVVDSQLISYALVFDTGNDEKSVATKTRDVRNTETTFSLESNDYTYKLSNSSQKSIGWAKQGESNPCGNALFPSDTAQNLWNLSSNATSIKIYSSNPTVHLAPIWSCTYSIAYNKNTSDSVSNVPSNISENISQPTKTYNINTTPSRTGYQFCGWQNTDNTIYNQPKQCSLTTEFDPDSYVNQTNNTELTLGISWTGNNQSADLKAIWKYKYTLNYYNNNGSTIYQTVVKLSDNNSSYTFTIKQDAPAAPPVTKAGNSMVFIGWSTNKDGSGTIYKKGGTGDVKSTITVPAYPNNTVNLYPVWREIVTFANADWKKFGSANIDTTSQANSIYLYGYRCTSANGGTYFTVDKDDTFELSASLTTSGIVTHPGGYVYITVGPLIASITNSGSSNLSISYGYKPLSYSLTNTSNTKLKTKTITNSGTVTIKLTKYAGVYTMSVNGDEVKIETRENGNGTYNVLKSDGSILASNRPTSELDSINVVYTMMHYSHCCSIIFNARLFDIKMTTTEVYY